jgi:hypothetical protein
MKLIKFSIIVVVAVMAIIGVSTTSYAFHSGGVATCESCHTMHNSLEGRSMTGQKSTSLGGVGSAAPGSSAVFLLRGTDQSSTCLNCHEGPTKSSYHVSTDIATLTSTSLPVNMGPGGDFGWLKINIGGTTERHGHNIVATDFGYVADNNNAAAPGGTYPASNLNCISCHNPHNTLRITDDTSGNFYKPVVGGTAYAPIAGAITTNTAAPSTTAPLGPFRFLAGLGYQPKSVTGGFAFTANPPAAVAPSDYNRSEGSSDTHVAYGSGMSDWCGNCHAAMNNQTGSLGSGGHPHPVNKALGTEISANYNAYKGSGDLTNATNGYSSLVPVEQGTGDYSLLRSAATTTQNGGSYTASAATSKVMCLSCHRAHATAFASMTRFNVAGNTTDTAGNWVLSGGSTAQASRAYYDRVAATSFTANTKTLCNKCHAKD